MSQRHTVPRPRRGIPIRGLRLRVEAGPDVGRELASSDETVAVGTAAGNALRLSDETVSRFHLTLRRAGPQIAVVDHGSTNGSQIGPALLRGGSALIDPRTTVILGDTHLRIDDGEISFEEEGPRSLEPLRGISVPMRRLYAAIERVAPLEVPVLFLGESGSGKELCAHALHARSRRADRPFVTVDCGALSPTLFLSELFGHERGAFSGADARRPGAFERAHGGTLFLDEIAELPLEQQSALLGTLERQRFRRLGGDREVKVDIRIIAATHRDLYADVNRGAFRLDLYYRLAVAVLAVPPLRERLEDIPVLVEHFLRDVGADTSLEDRFPAEEMERLRRHTWPGNVRELRNAVVGALALGERAELVSRTAGATSADPIAAAIGLPYREARGRVLENFEERYLSALLARADGNIRQAARDGRMDRSYLMELLRRHGMR